MPSTCSGGGVTTTGTFTAVYGKDFIVRPEADGSWPDMVEESDVNAADPRKYMDPDVFILPDGTVVMLAGCERYWEETPGNYVNYNGNPLGRFEGVLADLTWPWSDAF